MKKTYNSNNTDTKGYVQVYTGNGKGKTTASFGLALRAAGAGKKVFIGQFVKGQIYSEVNAVEKFLSDYVTIKQYGLDCFITKEPKQEDIEAAKAGLKEMEEIIISGKYDLIIMEEANIAVYFKLFSIQELIDVINKKHEATEIIVTGRYAAPEMIERADLVTEMREIKHYYQKGVQARLGIEY